MAKWDLSKLPEGRKPLPDEWFAERAQMQERIKGLEAQIKEDALQYLSDTGQMCDRIEELEAKLAKAKWLLGDAIYLLDPDEEDIAKGGRALSHCNHPRRTERREVMTDKLTGYINVYTNGRTSKLCTSRKAADHVATQVALDRICVWLVEYDANGDNPTISTERIKRHGN